jgi:hypothetical protein
VCVGFLPGVECITENDSYHPLSCSPFMPHFCTLQISLSVLTVYYSLCYYTGFLLSVLARFLETVVTLLVLGEHVHKLQITCNCYTSVYTGTFTSKKTNETTSDVLTSATQPKVWKYLD